jgi:hypothetical protein
LSSAPTEHWLANEFCSVESMSHSRYVAGLGEAFFFLRFDKADLDDSDLEDIDLGLVSLLLRFESPSSDRSELGKRNKFSR